VQGAGKTTSVAKLAKHLRGAAEEDKVIGGSVADVVSVRGIKQLETLAKEVDGHLLPVRPQAKKAGKPLLKAAMREARSVSWMC